MWTGPDARPINLPAALARRRLVGGAFLEEVMTPAAASGHDSFTRIAHHNYNAVSRRYEYASLDTRAPQMMTYEAGTNSSMRAQDGVMLQGGTFVAPQWGEASNITFEYRLQISEIEQSRQSVRLYLKRLRGEDAEEFLAFEYVYTRRH